MMTMDEKIVVNILLKYHFSQKLLPYKEAKTESTNYKAIRI